VRYSNFVPEIFDFQKYRDLEIPVKGHKGHWNWYHSIDFMWFPIYISVTLVPKMRRFSDIRLQKKSWPLNPGQWSLKVINDTIRQTGYGFLLVFLFYSNFVPKTHRFLDIRLQRCCDFENHFRYRVRQDHWKCHHSIERIWLHIDVLYSNYASILCRFNVERCRDLEIRVTDYSRSSEPTIIDPPLMIFYDVP